MRFGFLFVVACLAGCSPGSGVTHVTAAAPPPKVAPATVESFKPNVTTVEQVLQALGPPTSEEAHPPGKQWRYRTGRCTLDIQLYPDVETKQYGTLAYKVKSDDDTDEGRRFCLAQLQSRLPAGR